MTQILVMLSLLSAIVSIVLGLGFCLTTRRLGTLKAVATTDMPMVAVIVPARNEERDLENAVRSILAQESVQVRVIIVDDHSSDRTPQIADSLALAHQAVTIIHNPPLAKGWFGKANAMQHGLLAATAPQGTASAGRSSADTATPDTALDNTAAYIVFTDADVIHSPRCFATALSEMRTQQLDFVSLCPLFEFESFWENALLPHALIAGTVQFLMLNVNDPRSTNAAAAGAFMLTRGDVLDRVDALACVKTEILDDVALAKVVKQHGFATRILLAPDLLTVRLFKSNHDAFWGLTKNILGAVNHPWMAIPAMFLPIFVYWIPLATAAIGIVTSEPVMMAAGLAAYGVQAALLLLVIRMSRIHWGKALFFPLAAIPVICCIVRALYHRAVSGGVAWRGRVIPLSERSA